MTWRAAAFRLALLETDGWKPISWRLAVIEGAFCLLGLQRGVLYLRERTGQEQNLSAIEGVLGIHTWGLLFVIAGALCLIGITWAWFTSTVLAGAMVAVGHVGLAALYASVGIGIIESVGYHNIPIDPFNDPFITAAAFLVSAVMIHPVFAAGIAAGLGAAKGEVIKREG